MLLSPQAEAQLAEQVASYYADPLGFVLFAYPWGEAKLPDGSYNPLAKKAGPEPWQRRLLARLGEKINDNLFLTAHEIEQEVARFARVSGHGVGKSALVAWLIHFLMATRRDTRGVVTANTAGQLETKTWPELAKWHDLFICKHWFQWTATSYYFKLYPEEKRKNYMVTAMTVSEHNSEAFQGLHNEAGTIFIIFDEASGIFHKLWSVAEGSFSDGEGFFFAFGNPTQPDGEFADCFDKNKELYDTESVDSRDVSHTNKTNLQFIITKYGADSDEARIRVYGQFPRQSYNGFIARDAIEIAQEREYTYDSGAPIIMAVDVARYGPDQTVIRCRQGRNGRLRNPIILHRKNNVQVAKVVAAEADLVRPDAIIIENTGPGAGVIDILRDKGYKVFEVHPGALSSEPENYDRVRDELWGKLRDWIVDEGCLPHEPALIEQLLKMQYSLDKKTGKYKIESKEEYMARTLLSSPDEADSLVLTFGVKIARRDRNLDTKTGAETRGVVLTDYDVMMH